MNAMNGNTKKNPKKNVLLKKYICDYFHTGVIAVISQVEGDTQYPVHQMSRLTFTSSDETRVADVDYAHDRHDYCVAIMSCHVLLVCFIYYIQNKT